MPEEITGLSNVDITEQTSGKVIKKSGQRVGAYYIITKSLKESQKSDVMKCIYIKGLFNFGACVIKEGSYNDSKDKHGRDIKDRLIWQKDLHQLLQDKVRVPRFIDCFEENGNCYLVIERIKGKTLGQLIKRQGDNLRYALISKNRLGKKFLGYIQKSIDLLENLHKENMVHRDATTNNFMITPAGNVALIDLELSYSLNMQAPSPPYQLGTHGFMSPQQLLTHVPTIEEDIYALGAVILQIWTNISPSKIIDTNFEILNTRLQFFVPDLQIFNIILKCLNPEIEKRPKLSVIRTVLNNYKSSSPAKKTTIINKTNHYNLSQIRQVIQQGIHTLGTPLLADSENGWFTESNKDKLAMEKNRINKAWYASYSKGAAGVIYTLSKALTSNFDINSSLPFITKGLELIETKYFNANSRSGSGLFTGAAGIAISINEAAISGLIDCKYLTWISSLLNRPNIELDLANGLSGQGVANIVCSSINDNTESDTILNKYIQQLLDKQEKDGSWRQINDRTKKVSTGYANGVAGIILFLLSYAEKHNNFEVIYRAERGLDRLMKCGTWSGDRILWKSSSGKEMQPWLNYGFTGLALTFIKAFSVLGNSIYKKYTIGTLNNHRENLIYNNLSHANGLSGLGEVYIEAYNILKENIWMERAEWIAQHIVHLQNIHPLHGSYWITEHERQPYATFETGISGILHFLLRYIDPGNFSFPMLPGKKKDYTYKALSKL